MSTPYMSEIRIVSFNYAPRGWAVCNGQQIVIAQNQALFSLLQTTFGGDGIRTFALPNFQGREPLHRGQQGGGSQYAPGQAGGEATHTLLTSEMALHTHVPSGSTDAPTLPAFTNNLWANAPTNHYATSANAAMAPAAIGNTGNNQGHENMPPFLVLNFIIALQGAYPSRN